MNCMQFGFKSGRGCHDAVYTMQGVVKYLRNHGSTAILCILDISQVFANIIHFALHIKLTAWKLPLSFLDVRIC